MVMALLWVPCFCDLRFFFVSWDGSGCVGPHNRKDLGLLGLHDPSKGAWKPLVSTEGQEGGKNRSPRRVSLGPAWLTSQGPRICAEN